MVPRKGSAVLQITFLGPFAGKFDGSLQLKNVDAGDSFEYGLTGLADEVIASNLSFLLLFSLPYHSFFLAFGREPPHLQTDGSQVSIAVYSSSQDTGS